MIRVAYYPGMDQLKIVGANIDLTLNLEACYPAPKNWMKKLDKILDFIMLDGAELEYFYEAIVEHCTSRAQAARDHGNTRLVLKYKQNIEYYKLKLQ